MDLTRSMRYQELFQTLEITNLIEFHINLGCNSINQFSSQQNLARYIPFKHTNTPVKSHEIPHGGFHKWWYPKIDGLFHGTPQSKIDDDWGVTPYDSGNLHISSGWWFEPLWKIWTSIGMIRNPIYGKIKNGNQTTNQSWFQNSPSFIHNQKRWLQPTSSAATQKGGRRVLQRSDAAPGGDLTMECLGLWGFTGDFTYEWYVNHMCWFPKSLGYPKLSSLF